MPIQAAADNLRREIQEREREASADAQQKPDLSNAEGSAQAATGLQQDGASLPAHGDEGGAQVAAARFVSAKKKLNDKKGSECCLGQT